MNLKMLCVKLAINCLGSASEALDLTMPDIDAARIHLAWANIHLGQALGQPLPKQLPKVLV